MIRRHQYRYTEQDYSEAIILVRELRVNQLQAQYADWADALLRERELDPDKIVMSAIYGDRQSTPIDQMMGIYTNRYKRGETYLKEHPSV